jgi:hypothetical protein
MRRPFKPTPLGATLQAASLVAVAAGVFGILISDITAVGRRCRQPRAFQGTAPRFAALP